MNRIYMHACTYIDAHARTYIHTYARTLTQIKDLPAQPLRFMCKSSRRASYGGLVHPEFTLRINKVHKYKLSRTAVLPSVETLAAKSHALADAIGRISPFFDPLISWRETSRSLHGLAQEDSCVGLAVYGHMLKEHASSCDEEQDVIARIRDISQRVSLDVLEALADTVQYVSNDVEVKAVVSLSVTCAHDCVCEKPCDKQGKAMKTD